MVLPGMAEARGTKVFAEEGRGMLALAGGGDQVQEETASCTGCAWPKEGEA